MKCNFPLQITKFGGKLDKLGRKSKRKKNLDSAELAERAFSFSL